LSQPFGQIEFAEAAPPWRLLRPSCIQGQLRKLPLQVKWWRDDQRRRQHAVKVGQSSGDVSAASAVGDVPVQLGIVPELVDQKSLSDVYALHGCSSTGLVSARASRSFPRRMWLFTVFNGKPMTSATSS
jgi:hypothetical protein